MDVPWRRDFDAARDPYTARNALGITSTGGGGGGVSSLNGETGAVTIAAGVGIGVGVTTGTITVSGAPFTSGTSGDVPASGGGSSNFLRADGSWAVPAGTGISDAPSDGKLYGRKNAAWTDTALSYQPLDADLTAIAGISAVQGDILYRDGSAWTRLPAGTSGQFLQTQGASANPQWATLAGGGNVSNSGTPTANQLAQWTDSTHIQGISTVPVAARGAGTLVELVRQTVSSPVATVDFTSGIDATYDIYELHIFNYAHSVASSIALRTSTDGGATWRSGATDYQYSGRQVPAGLTGAADAGSAGATSISLTLAARSTSANGEGTVVAKFFQPAATAPHTVVWQAFGHHATNGYFSVFGSGVMSGASASTPYDGVRIFPSSGGNINTGTFVLYGVKK